MAEFRVFGPPGTGKTTWLAHQVRRAVEARGSDAVMVTSFTRAAARELTSRDLPIDMENVGTLHAICYRALSRPTIAEGKLNEWNSYCPQSIRLNAGKTADPDQPFEGEFFGDGEETMARYQVLRSKCVPREMMPQEVRFFDKHWSDWKAETGYLDFTDLLEVALADLEHAPGKPSVLFMDEAQDATPLMWRLVRKWGAQADDLIVVGDADQTLYDWAGADPRSMIDPPVPEKQERILSRSYRVPESIHAISQRWIRNIGSRRKDVVFLPRENAKGCVTEHRTIWTDRDMVLSLIDQLSKDNDTVMVLASCAYMLRPTIAGLRAEGIPFHNPYRKHRGDWNPMHPITVGRLLNFLQMQEHVWGDKTRLWTYKEMREWANLLRAEGVFLRGGKAALDKIGPQESTREVSLNYLTGNVFTDAAMRKIWDGDVQWLLSHLLKPKSYEYPIAMYTKHGSSALFDTPRVLVGTIHSVKGGEADAVILFPDISPSASRSKASEDGRDALTRTFYVGMTRAKNALALCASSGNLCVQW